MSIGAELAFARCAAALGNRVAYLSDRGAGSPLLSALVSVERLALRPVGGVRMHPFRHYAPPVHFIRSPGDAKRLVRDVPLLLDGSETEISVLRRALQNVREEPPEMIRTRGKLAGAPEGMRCLFEQEASGDMIWCRADLVERAAEAVDASITQGAADEFDQLAHILARVDWAGGIKALRYAPEGAEVRFHPPAVLNAPEPGQLDTAFGEGRAIFDSFGSLALAIPHLSAAPVHIGVSVAVSESADVQPVLLGVPSEWRIEVRNQSEVWHFRLHPDSVSEVSVLELALSGHGHGEIIDVWSGARRQRSPWESWDEAGAQLDLEQSW
jgi:hypothetical protein